MRDKFKLAGWVEKLEKRRHGYFAWCDRATDELTGLLGAEPTDEQLMLVIVAALVEDDSFAGYVKKLPGDWKTKPHMWRKLYRVGACTILEEYRTIELRELP